MVYPTRLPVKELTMRKKRYVRDLLNPSVTPDGNIVELSGWIKRRRHHGRITFIDVVDSTGSIQVVAHSKSLSTESYDLAVSIPVESAIARTFFSLFRITLHHTLHYK